MSTLSAFQPRWASAPGDTIREALEERQLSVEDLADRLTLTDADARRLVLGDLPINTVLAEGLAASIGGTARFWSDREAQYQQSLGLLRADEIAEKLPISQMAEFGWIQTADNWEERAQYALRYFGVQDAESWNERWGKVLENTRFRTSPSFASADAAIAVWLRQAEIEVDTMKIGPWSSEAFRAALRAIRAITKLGDPVLFVPKVQALCASAGVAVAFVRAPKGCKVSGAAFLAHNQIPTIVLSARHLTDDHLWFTFFHESGHVLQHELSSAFLDTFDEDVDASVNETEADDFAQEILLPHGLEQMHSRTSAPTMREVVLFASAIGIAPGIVVGQLQHAGLVEQNRLNKLKRRYVWDGTTLKT